jgi:hypothetical protein
MLLTADELVHALVWGSAEAISSVSVLVSVRSRLPYRAPAGRALSTISCRESRDECEYRTLIAMLLWVVEIVNAVALSRGHRGGTFVSVEKVYRIFAYRLYRSLVAVHSAQCGGTRVRCTLLFRSAAVHVIVGTYSLVLAVFTL